MRAEASLPHPRAGRRFRRPSTDKGEARGEAARVGAKREDYDYNALGALKVNASVALDHQRPKLAGGGNADAAVPATVGGQPITLDSAGRITSLRGTTFTWSRKGYLRSAQDPAPAVLEEYAVDAQLRRFAKTQGTSKEYYIYEGLDRIATLNTTGAVVETWLFDGIDHPLRIKQGATTAYYELDLAGNVRGLRGPSGTNFGIYRYSAFGQILVDTTTLTQSLRWKGRWHSSIAGGTYDIRARQWAPELGVFLSIDGFGYHRPHTSLWGWPHQNPITWSDKTGHLSDREICLLTQVPIAVGAVACAIVFSETVVGIAVCLGGGIALAAVIISQCPPPDPPPPPPGGPAPPSSCPARK